MCLFIIYNKLLYICKFRKIKVKEVRASYSPNFLLEIFKCGRVNELRNLMSELNQRNTLDYIRLVWRLKVG